MFECALHMLSSSGAGGLVTVQQIVGRLLVTALHVIQVCIIDKLSRDQIIASCLDQHARALTFLTFAALRSKVDLKLLCLVAVGLHC